MYGRTSAYPGRAVWINRRGKTGRSTKVMEEGNIESLILPVDRMFDQYPAAKTTPQGDLLVHNGNRIFPELLQEELRVDGGYVRVYDSRETFIGLYEKKTDQMIPVKMFYRKENEA